MHGPGHWLLFDQPRMEPDIVLAAVNSSSSINIYDVATATSLASLHNNHSDPHGISISQDPHSMVYSVQNDRGIVSVWAWNKESPVAKHVAPEKLSCCSISPDGVFLVAGAHSGKVYIWNTESGDLLAVLEAHYKRISVVCFTPDGQGFLTGSDDASVKLYLLSDALLNGGASWTWSDHSLPVTDVVVSRGTSLSTTRCFSASLDRTVKIRDVATGSVLLSILFPMSLTSLQVDAAETWLVAGGVDGTVAKANLYQNQGFLTAIPSDQADWITTFPKTHMSAVRSLAVNSRATIVASGDDSGKLCLVDVQSMQTLKSIDATGKISQLVIVARPHGFMEAVNVGIKPVPLKRVMNS